MSILKAFYNFCVGFVVRSSEIQTTGRIPSSYGSDPIFSKRNYVKLNICPKSLVIEFDQSTQSFNLYL